VEAVRWYRRAVAQENAYAECDLGLSYEKGQGVPQDYSEAAKWYRKAIANGNQNAKESLERVEQKIAATLKKKTMNISRDIITSDPSNNGTGNIDKNSRKGVQLWEGALAAERKGYVGALAKFVLFKELSDRSERP